MTQAPENKGTGKGKTGPVLHVVGGIEVTSKPERKGRGRDLKPRAKRGAGKITRRTGPVESGLTQKQEAFALAVFSGKNFSDAYREAYECSGSTAASIHRQAHGLVNHVKVRSRLEQLWHQKREEQRMQALSRGDFVIEQLSKIIADQKTQDGAKVRALELLGKSVALWTDKVETEDKTDRSADEIERELTAKLKRLGLG